MRYAKLSDFDFDLPDDLIATHPAEPRDHSRLLVLDKKTGKIEHKHFFDIIDYLNAGDILVLNNSKVIPARLFGFKKGTGGKVEVLLHKKIAPAVWQCLLGGKVQESLELKFTITHPVRAARPPLSRGELSASVLKNNHDGTWDLKFNKSGAALMKAIEKIGEVPLPPYILNQRKKEYTHPVSRGASHPSQEGNDNVCHCEEAPGADEAISPRAKDAGLLRFARNDKNDYQTVFADAKKAGSVAAPTAGLHFTPELLRKIKKKGVKILEITLYVGMGTFAPVKTEDITKHKMHAEWVEIDRSAINQLRIKKEEIKKGGQSRIIAVGTTSCRSLEACGQKITTTSNSNHSLKTTPSPSLKRRGDFKAWVDIFIAPGYEFKIVDALITNFHLPKSTLLMLVSALAGKKNIDKAYAEAIKKKYRFYSYGDAMLIK